MTVEFQETNEATSIEHDQSNGCELISIALDGDLPECWKVASKHRRSQDYTSASYSSEAELTHQALIGQY